MTSQGAARRKWTRAWGKVRAACLDRDEHQCLHCGSKEKLEAHHVLRREHGGTDTLDNLVTLCHSCHLDESPPRQPPRPRVYRKRTDPAARIRGRPWQVVRARIIKRDGCCVACGHPGSPGNELHVDHIVPLNRGGEPFDEDNLQVLCRVCHKRKDTWERRVGKGQAPWYSPTTLEHIARMDATSRLRREVAERKQAERREKIDRYRERAIAAFRMREEGVPWKKIAADLGLSSPGAAHNLVFGGDKRRWAPGRDGLDGEPGLTRGGGSIF